MKKKLASLDFACPADWDKMKSCDGGRFCGSCSKVVYDFTNQKNPVVGEIGCGKFDLSQLASINNTIEFKRAAVYTLSLLSFIGAASFSNETQAQNVIELNKSSETDSSFVFSGTLKNKITDQPFHSYRINFFIEDTLLATTLTNHHGQFKVSLTLPTNQIARVNVAVIGSDGERHLIKLKGSEILKFDYAVLDLKTLLEIPTSCLISAAGGGTFIKDTTIVGSGRSKRLRLRKKD